eukprot:jgi/Tetstr1/441170/TSEL_029428.t1
MPDNSGDAPSGLAENHASPRMRPVLRGLRSFWKPYEVTFGSLVPSPGFSPIPQLYDISSDETHRQLIARRHWATLDQYRSLYCFGFYDAVANAALYEALASIKRAASAAQPPTCLLKPGFADYGSEAVAQLSDELLRREAEYSVTAAAKAAVQQRFGVGPDPNEEEEDDDEPPSRARRRRPFGRHPRQDFRPTADDADKGKGKGKA